MGKAEQWVSRRSCSLPLPAIGTWAGVSLLPNQPVLMAEASGGCDMANSSLSTVGLPGDLCHSLVLLAADCPESVKWPWSFPGHNSFLQSKLPIH